MGLAAGPEWVAGEGVNMDAQRIIGTALDRVREASEISEREALAVGKLVGTIMEVAQHQKGSLETSLKHFSDASDASVRHVAAAQSEATATYLEQISTLIDEQSEIARQAATQCEQISKAGSTIEQATIEARILSLNARITAAQSNSDSAAFAAIASEMQTLSQTVAQANALVSQLATDLNRQLPLIAKQADAMRNENEHFSTVLHEHIGRVEDTTSNLEGTLRDTISSGSTHYSQILRASQRALSHLQYQDPMVQRLRRTCMELETLLTGDPADLDVADAEAPYMAGDDAESGGGSEDAGEVLLF